MVPGHIRVYQPGNAKSYLIPLDLTLTGTILMYGLFVIAVP